MPQTHAMNTTFKQTSAYLKEQLGHAYEAMLSFKDHSSKVMSTMAEDLDSSWQNWSKALDDYKVSLRELPKELRQRQFTKKVMHRLDELELEVQRLKSLNYKEELHVSFETKRVEFSASIQRLSVSIDAMKDEVAQLEENPLVQKFLRGETVLSCRKNLQWGRKIAHVSIGLFFLYFFVYSGLPKWVIWTSSLAFVAWEFAMEIGRHNNPKFNAWVCKVFRPFMREDEKTKINSAIFYTVSILLTYILCPIEVAILTLLFVSVGDTAAGVIGVYYGKHKISKHVSLEGWLGCFAVCTLMSAVYAGWLFENPIHGFSWFFFSVIAGAVAAVSEGCFKRLDDNFVIPMISAPCLWVLMWMFSIL
jgi:dolichol kinase